MKSTLLAITMTLLLGVAAADAGQVCISVVPDDGCVAVAAAPTIGFVLPDTEYVQPGPTIIMPGGVTILHQAPQVSPKALRGFNWTRFRMRQEVWRMP